MSSRVTSIQLEEGSDEDRLELPGQPYALALWNLIIRPPRRRYDLARLGPSDFRLWSLRVRRVDVNLTNARGMQLRCSHFLPRDLAEGGPGGEPRPVVVYLHQNASCRLEALNLVPLFLPLGISLFAFDFAGCGESDGEYISLGWFERDDLAECVDYLRKSGKVSAVGLWGRSMGAVTALMHADRDHSIGGMVLDSPFCNLTTLASELAQSEYLAVKVPSWLLSGALALGRMRIKSLCGFDIERLAPERHVGDSYIPALFVHGWGDDFIGPHHTQKLFEAYNGDKELEMVDGDHNSPRPAALNRKAVLFFCRAFRCNPAPQGGESGNLARMLGLDALGLGGSLDQPYMSKQLTLEAGKQLALVGSLPAAADATEPQPQPRQRPWLGERQQVFLPFRAEGALQLCEASSEAGFCVCALPTPSEWGGVSRPPEVVLAYVAADGLHVALAAESGREEMAHALCHIDLAVPVLCVLELRPNPTRLRLTLGSGGPELEYLLREEYEQEVVVWLWDSRRGEASFFDCAFMDLTPPLVTDGGTGGGAAGEAPVLGGAAAAGEAAAAMGLVDGGGPAALSRGGPALPPALPAARPQVVRRGDSISSEARQRRPAADAGGGGSGGSGGYCQSQ